MIDVKRTLRILAIVALVLLFSATGLAKLVSPSSFSEQFAHFGLPAWWIPVTAATELLGATLVALPRRAFRLPGAAMLAGTMAVATGLHLLHDPAAQALPAAILMLLAGYVAWISRDAGATRGSAGG